MHSQDPVKLTAMHYWHLSEGATMKNDNGWLRPSQYQSMDTETQYIKSSVGICDISPVSKTDLQSHDLGNHIVQLRTLTVGSCMNHKFASVKTPVLIAKLTDTEAMMISKTETGPTIAEIFAKQDADCIHAVDITSGLAGISIIGPESRSILASSTDVDISNSNFPNMSCSQIRFAEVHALLLRLDFNNTLAFELYFTRDFGVYIWEAVTESAQHYGGGPIGIDALESLRLEHPASTTGY